MAGSGCSAGGRAPVPETVWEAVAYSRRDTAAQLAAALRPFGTIGDMPALSDTDQVEDVPHLLHTLSSLSDPLPEQVLLAEWLGSLRPDFSTRE